MLQGREMQLLTFHPPHLGGWDRSWETPTTGSTPLIIPTTVTSASMLWSVFLFPPKQTDLFRQHKVENQTLYFKPHLHIFETRGDIPSPSTCQPLADRHLSEGTISFTTIESITCPVISSTIIEIWQLSLFPSLDNVMVNVTTTIAMIIPITSIPSGRAVFSGQWGHFLALALPE